jgi:polar amino acid transport system substrate-binding protein
MKKLRVVVLCMLLFACVSSSEPNTSTVTDTLSVSTGEWLPYLGLERSVRPGYMVEIVRAIFSGAGYYVVIVEIPFSRALEYLKKGAIDAVSAAFAEDVDSSSAMLPKEEIGIARRAFFVRAGDSWHYTGIQSLSSVRLGLIIGEVYPEIEQYLTQNQKSGRVEYLSGIDGYRRNVTKLLSGRIDAVFEVPEVVRFYATEAGRGDSIRQAGSLGAPRKLYIAFSRRNPKSLVYGELLSRGIVEMRKSGELQRILSRYYVQDWKK